MKTTARYIILILLPFFIGSCATFKPSMLQSRNAPIESMVHNLLVNISPGNYSSEASNIGYYYDSYSNALIYSELAGNVIKNEDLMYGMIEVIPVKVSQDSYGLGGCIVSSFTGCIINLLGFPFLGSEYSGEYDIVLSDIKGNIIKRYTYKSTDKSLTGVYYGRGNRVVYLDMIEDIIKQFRYDIINDADDINMKLEEAMSNATEDDLQNMINKQLEIRRGNAVSCSTSHSQSMSQIQTTSQSLNFTAPTIGRSKESIARDLEKRRNLLAESEARLAHLKRTKASSVVIIGTESNIRDLKKAIYELEIEYRNAAH